MVFGCTFVLVFILYFRKSGGPCVELAAAQEELVAVVGGEKQAMVAVVGFGLLSCCLLRCCLLRC